MLADLLRDGDWDTQEQEAILVFNPYHLLLKDDWWLATTAAKKIMLLM